jgi:(p)ppGpp synthase/HD superfamily hydrolase
VLFTDQIRLAIDTAARAYDGQRRKDQQTTPVISHPFGVAMILSQYPDISEDTIIAGLLHDVIEDVDPMTYSSDDIRNDFGEDVLEIVQQVSDDPHIKDWQLRKQAYLRELETARTEALMVSAADMTHNLASFVDSYKQSPEMFGKRFTGTPEQQVWFYGERAGLIHQRLEHPIAEGALEAYSQFEEVLSTSS